MVLEWCQTCSSIRDTYFLQTSPRSVLVRMIIIVEQSGGLQSAVPTDLYQDPNVREV